MVVSERIGVRRRAVDVQHGHGAVHGVGDIGAGAVGGKRDAVGLLADGDLGKARAAVLQVEERDGVVVRVGDEQQRIVRAQRQRLGTGGAGEAGQRLRGGMPGIAVPGQSPRPDAIAMRIDDRWFCMEFSYGSFPFWRGGPPLPPLRIRSTRPGGSRSSRILVRCGPARLLRTRPPSPARTGQNWTSAPRPEFILRLRDVIIAISSSRIRTSS